MIWLPLAYRSGIKFSKRQKDADPDAPFECVVPFSRFNKNWYKAMAGAALLANSEVAGGMFIFKACGGDYTVVCKNLTYSFRRPCMGPAIYRIVPREDIAPLVDAGRRVQHHRRHDHPPGRPPQGRARAPRRQLHRDVPRCPQSELPCP